jgi:hypothetical protein
MLTQNNHLNREPRTLKELSLYYSIDIIFSNNNICPLLARRRTLHNEKSVIAIKHSDFVPRCRNIDSAQFDRFC